MSPTYLFILFVAGLAGGFIDSIAGGGGLITVPTLLALGLPPQLALGTNKAQSSCGTIMSVWRYGRAGLISWPQVRLAVILSFIASMAGAWCVTMISSASLKAIVPWMLLAIVIYVIFSPKLGEKARSARLPLVLFSLIFGTTLGFYDGFFGPGTGAFWTIATVGLLGLELTQATAFTKAVNLASNLGSLIIFSLKGDVLLPVVGVMVAGQLIGTYIGAGLVLANGAVLIRRVFLGVVVALVIKLLFLG